MSEILENKKALIAMSGGVDSSVSAVLTQKAGYECSGATMKLYDNSLVENTRGKTCCSLDDVEDARAVARKLNMPFYVFNFTEEFNKEVIQRFVDAYETGATPNPCIDCNRYMKFQKFYQRSRELRYDKIVTGHYARIEQNVNGRFLLKKAKNTGKDQSYVLYSMTQEQLSHTLFPLGEFESKEQVRELAQEFGFLNAHKPDSQDICFVPDGKYIDFIKQYTGKNYPEGDFVDINGEVIGTHKGIIGYTVGQRKGLGVAFGRPVYVVSKNANTNCVVLGDEKDLYSSSCTANNINLIACDNIYDEINVTAQIRYNQTAQPAKVVQTDKDKLLITFDEPQRGVASGQAVVLYDGDTVIGGGTLL